MKDCNFVVIGRNGDFYVKQCQNCGWTYRKSKYPDPAMLKRNCRWLGTPDQVAFAIAKNIAAGGCKTCGRKPRAVAT